MARGRPPKLKADKDGLSELGRAIEGALKDAMRGQAFKDLPLTDKLRIIERAIKWEEVQSRKRDEGEGAWFNQIPDDDDSPPAGAEDNDTE